MFLCPWNFPSKNTGVGCHSLFQEIFPTQEWNPGILHCRQILYCLSHSVQFSRSIVSDSWWPHGLQHARLPCPSPSPGAYSSSCALSQRCHPTSSSSVVPFSSSLQSFLASGSSRNESVLRIRWPKYWSFSFSISPSNAYSGLISSRMDWLDLLAVQETVTSLFQHHSSKASILQHSAFFIVQLSHPYMTTGKTKTLSRRTFVDKVMSLLFNMLSEFLICSFSSKEQVSFNFMAAVTICSDFGAPPK